jgi:3-hydroxyisobutyrate dehydrogenase
LLGQRTGIDPAVLQHALAGSSAASAFIRQDIDRAFHGDYLASFGLDRICEELDAVTALARDHEVPWELSGLVRRTYHRALARYGPADGELLAVALLEEQAGHKLRPQAQPRTSPGPAPAPGRPREEETPPDAR